MHGRAVKKGALIAENPNFDDAHRGERSEATFLFQQGQILA